MTIRYLTAGESHGPALSGIIDGVPAHIHLEKKDFDSIMLKRKQGYGRGKRQIIETDEVEILSGIIGGYTTGAPISLLIRNKDYENHKSYMHPFNKPNGGEINIPLPGHADLSGAIKYGFDDCRPIRERASARTTAIQVALSVPVRKFLKENKIFSLSFIEAIGGINANIDYNLPINEQSKLIEENMPNFMTPDKSIISKWKQAIDSAKSENTSLGGTGCVVFYGIPFGLGSHIQHDTKLDGKLAGEIMGIQGIKGIEIGNAIEISKKQNNASDDIYINNDGNIYRKTNQAGGIEGGMSNAQPLIIRFHMKPLPGGNQAKESINLINGKSEKSLYYRSDTCAIQSACIVAESLASIIIASEFLNK